METDLLQSTSLKSGAKASHHAHNILRIRLLCQAQLVPFVQKKIAATSRKRASPDYTARALLRQKKALTPHFPNDRPNAFKKLDHLSWLKRSCGWREPEVSPGKCREGKGKKISSSLHLHTVRISHRLIPLFPWGTNEVINQPHSPTETRKWGPETWREQSWGGQKHCKIKVDCFKKQACSIVAESCTKRSLCTDQFCVWFAVIHIPAFSQYTVSYCYKRFFVLSI